MKTVLSSVALGAALACACHPVVAAPTVTTTQQGIANTAYTEQIGGDALTAATIVQIGNNNRAGDPLAQTPGIYQRMAPAASASIRQQGDGNTANIVQDGTRMPVTAQIGQVGNRNTAAITQTIVTYSDASLSQTGTGNVARLDQSQVADLGFRGIQNGTDNYLSFRQNNAVYGTPVVTQMGTANAVSVNQDGVLFSGGTTIEQNGSMNTVASTLQGVTDTIDSVRQTGIGNAVTTTQTFSNNVSSVIVQNGNNNVAALTQNQGLYDSSQITQIGNRNSATVVQRATGSGGNVAIIRQIGDAYVANVTQTGANNSVGIYQH